MHIIKLEVDGIKRLKAVAIEPNGAVVQVVGRNAQGKSSVLDSILMALGGGETIAKEPIRRGQEHASVRLDLGDLIVRRAFGPNGASRVTVESREGARYPSPQAMLDGLIGPISFDPLAFTRQSAKQQLDTLRALVKLDVDVDQLALENQRDYQLRAEHGRAVKQWEGRVATLAEGLDPAMDVAPIDVAAIGQEMDRAARHNEARDAEKARRIEDRARAESLAIEIKEIDAKIARLTEIRATKSAAYLEIEDGLTALPALPDRIDTTAMSQILNDGVKENLRRDHQRQQREKHEAASAELLEARRTVVLLTAAMEERNARSAEAIAAAQMPIPGLSFGDGGVLYNGLPLEQASSAEQLRVSFAVAMAMNPTLRVALIRDGSLLDAESLALIAEMAAANDYQVWIERVSDGDSPVGIVIEDGEVVAVDGVPVEHAEQEVAAD